MNEEELEARIAQVRAEIQARKRARASNAQPYALFAGLGIFAIMLTSAAIYESQRRSLQRSVQELNGCHQRLESLIRTSTSTNGRAAVEQMNWEKAVREAEKPIPMTLCACAEAAPDAGARKTPFR